MLPHFYQLHYTNSYESVDRLINEKIISKKKCINQLESIVSMTEHDLDILCFAVHNIEKEVLKVLKKNVQVRIIFREQSRKKLNTFAKKLSKRGAMVRWMPANQILFSNILLRDMKAASMKPTPLTAAPVVMVSKHDSTNTKIINDVMSAVFFNYKSGQLYHIKFEEIWEMLAP